LKYKTLRHDTVSFGYLHEEVPQDLQVYRCIGESEYKALLNGETIECGKYVTSSPMGWLSKNWNNGFIYNENKGKDVYFITFKIGKLEITSRRDNEKDSRYGLWSEYTLDDISNIRKGFNTHGELVWAENFIEEKKKDVEHKKIEISKLMAKIESNCSIEERKSAIDELASYSKEFPQIVELFEKFVDYNNENDINDLVYLINKTDCDKFLPQYRKCLNSIENGVAPHRNFYDFLKKYGSKEDLNTVLNLIKGKHFIEPMNLSQVLNNLTDDVDKDFIIKELNDNDMDNLIILSSFILARDEDGRYSDIMDNILNKGYFFHKNLQEDDNETEDKINYIIDPCIKYMEKFNIKTAIGTMELFCQDDMLKTWWQNDIRYAIARLKEN